MRAVVNCRVCELAIALQLLVVTIHKRSINPIANPNPVCSQRDNTNDHGITILEHEPFSRHPRDVHDHTYRRIVLLFRLTRHNDRGGTVHVLN
jgi:hypothetical protein